jgi:type IV secretory pathway TrbD component
MSGLAEFFYSFLAGCVLFAVLYAAARWSTVHDPQMLQILLRSGTSRRRYDPAQYTAVAVPDAQERA